MIREFRRVDRVADAFAGNPLRVVEVSDGVENLKSQAGRQLDLLVDQFPLVLAAAGLNQRPRHLPAQQVESAVSQLTKVFPPQLIMLIPPSVVV